MLACFGHIKVTNPIFNWKGTVEPESSSLSESKHYIAK